MNRLIFLFLAITLFQTFMLIHSWGINAELLAAGERLIRADAELKAADKQLKQASNECYSLIRQANAAGGRR